MTGTALFLPPAEMVANIIATITTFGAALLAIYAVRLAWSFIVRYLVDPYTEEADFDTGMSSDEFVMYEAYGHLDYSQAVEQMDLAISEGGEHYDDLYDGKDLNNYPEEERAMFMGYPTADEIRGYEELADYRRSPEGMAFEEAERDDYLWEAERRHNEQRKNDMF